jgi:hypothetical protein
MRLSSPQYMLHALLISVFLIWSPEWYLVRNTEHKAPRYVVFSTHLSLVPLKSKYPPQQTVEKSVFLLHFCVTWCRCHLLMLHSIRNTRWFKYDWDKLWLVYTQIVSVIFEPPCTWMSWNMREMTVMRINQNARRKSCSANSCVDWLETETVTPQRMVDN